MLQAIRKSPLNSLITVVVLVLLAVSVCIWSKARSWDLQITSSEGWYQYPELSRTEIRDSYDKAFKKIVLLNGFAFASLFLLIKAKERKA